MNTLLLLLGLRPWTSATSTDAFTRVFVAVSLLSMEVQFVTLAGVGTLPSLVPLNAVAAVAAFLLWRPSPVRDDTVRVRPLRAVPPVAALAMAVLVLIVNLSRPFEAADLYHLEKIDRIERTGTLAYDTATETKINILNSTYELLLADLRSVPAAGPWLVRIHGVWGLLLFLVAVGAVREQLGRARRETADATDNGPPVATPGESVPLAWAALLVVPVLFHQFVLVKNDLVVGILALVVLAWTMSRAAASSPREIVWASWLGGMAVAVKLTSLPLLVVVGATLLLRRDRWRAVGAMGLGSAAGLLCGGLAFTLVENLRIYGSLMPVENLGNRPRGAVESIVDILRFSLSLVDLGQLTRRLWPGRGGWGGTFGLPLVWAVATLVVRRRVSDASRPALLTVGACFLAFAAAFPDADVAQRLVLGPGLLLVAVAVDDVTRAAAAPTTAWLRFALAICTALSCLQIARSAWLYMQS